MRRLVEMSLILALVLGFWSNSTLAASTVLEVPQASYRLEAVGQLTLEIEDKIVPTKEFRDFPFDTRDRSYSASEIEVAVDGSTLAPSRVTVVSNLQGEHLTARHQGTVEVVSTTARLLLEYRGEASLAFSFGMAQGPAEVMSQGEFKVVAASGAFATLGGREGSYSLTILEHGQEQGSAVTLSFSTGP